MVRATRTGVMDDHLREKRRRIYNDMPVVRIDTKVSPTADTCQQADLLFDIEIMPRPKGYKQDEKRAFFRQVLFASPARMLSSIAP